MVTRRAFTCAKVTRKTPTNHIFHPVRFSWKSHAIWSYRSKDCDRGTLISKKECKICKGQKVISPVRMRTPTNCTWTLASTKWSKSNIHGQMTTVKIQKEWIDYISAWLGQEKILCDLSRHESSSREIMGCSQSISTWVQYWTVSLETVATVLLSLKVIVQRRAAREES